jgi:hypothetical protein
MLDITDGRDRPGGLPARRSFAGWARRARQAFSGGWMMLHPVRGVCSRVVLVTFVHAFDVFREMLHDAAALQLERRRDQVVVDRPGIERAGGAVYLRIAGKAGEQDVKFLANRLFQRFLPQGGGIAGIEAE